ncbi:hypothetical protein LOK49_LG11G02395 [Camellia lanceoleosa]|uniref:Uncharacterized protein n=1 Tax=Camellia lanceoleosa TaxID=1840588 RepID=A0ACC0FZ77_9ERIC|nr:hypothetical protein LOK49_LG11G02395 [Camellia lanceoleosa]
MGSNSNNASLALFFLLNFLFFAFASAQCAPRPPPRPPPSPPPPPPSPGPPPPPSPSTGSCPIDALKIGVCVDLLPGLINVIIGRPPVNPCCSLIGGLVNLEAAICLCTVLKLNVLGLPVSIPVALSLLLNNCGKTTPPGFQCP